LAEPERDHAAAGEDAHDLDQLERGIDGDLVAHCQHLSFWPVRLCTRTWRTVSAVSCCDAYVIARQAAHCALAVVTVVRVVAQPASMENASNAAATRSSRLLTRPSSDLALGTGARRTGACLSRGFGGFPFGFLMANALDVEFRPKEEEDHAHGRDRDGGVTR